MENLSQQRCFNHALREAVARCLECRRCYCRECVTEHDDRLICASCLKKLAATPGEKKRTWQGVATVVGLVAGILITWMFFYSFGRTLLLLPTSFHEGTVWQNYKDQVD